MPWFEPARITQPVALRGLILGFALVVALLGAAGFVAVRGTRAIENDAAQVGREQLGMARLLNDVQAGQNTMAAILHKLAPGQPGVDGERLLRDLETADRALRKVAAAAASTSEAEQWRELDIAARDFSSGVREALRRGPALKPSDLGPLFQLHDRVVRIEQQLLEASERRMEETEQRIENESRDLAANSRILLSACFVLAVVCALVTVVFARSSIRRIESQASELSRVSWQMLQSQETMARRFSHELHDELGQSLAAVKANLTAATAEGEWASRRADCVGLVDQSIANVRELSQLLHPVILDDFGLDAGLRWLTEGFGQRTGIAVAYHSSFTARLDDPVETHLFRIAQEALTNIARHSGATLARVDLHALGPRLQLVIEDNGRGFRERASPVSSLGMTGMRARAHEIQGELRVTSPPQGGVRIEVEVPLKTTVEDDVEPENAHSAR